MGEQHVPLQINKDGLVTKVGYDMGGSYEYEATANPKYTQQEIPFPNNNIFETCIMCGKTTDVLVDTHIDFRYGYVEGAGQLCRSCYLGEDRNLITIEGRTILDTPNDAELGAKVRQMYWENKK